ncbi:unnamed protein product [Linum tenue]|uniref:Uncharacterized protein n=1 Tax=Linum tenue TaxID=586396 RepID=A0AAV0QRW8_9ROSI|nr:unnamed protein product [Linum tenue]
MLLEIARRANEPDRTWSAIRLRSSGSLFLWHLGSLLAVIGSKCSIWEMAAALVMKRPFISSIDSVWCARTQNHFSTLIRNSTCFVRSRENGARKLLLVVILSCLVP